MGKIIKYNMKLNVITPIHIGNADYKTKLNSNEYVYDAKSGTLTLINNKKFVDLLIEKDLFERYYDYIYENTILKKNRQDKKVDLGKFLKDVNLYREIEKFTKKRYENLNLNTKNGKTNDMKLLLRDAHGKPYIPGSSIKGAVVNSLLVDYILKNRNVFENDISFILNSNNSIRIEQDIKKYQDSISKTISNIQNIILYGEPKKNSDIKKFGISISDTYERENDEFKADFFQDFDEKIKDGSCQSIPMFREYIMPNSTFYFDLTLDFDRIEKSRLKIKNAQDIINSISNATDYLIDKVLNDKFSKKDLILGGNTGFHQKTIVYSLFEDKDKRTDIVRKLLHKSSKNKITNHLNDKNAPRVINRVKINGEYELAGLAKISVLGEKYVGTN
ncbi:type III-A CRISPR-associated RAMP protein Csm5 [Peptoanaerobacter stomatis]|jgi:CRISPR-associated RAMP protein, csm5 family